jgi:RND family efflux transporter MFP subunit
MQPNMRAPFGWGLFLAVLMGLTGCSQGPPRGPVQGTPTVAVSYPLLREITDYQQYTARTAATDAVQVRARVSGYLESIQFEEGADVAEGALLYQIDPRPYQAALEQAQAQVNLQQAQLTYQEAVYRRNVRLNSEGQAVSLEELQQSRAAQQTTVASLNAAKAVVQQAQLNLDWTKVQSPIRGRIGRTLVTRGNLVAADQTVLTTVVSQDPMYVYFDVDESTVLRIQQLIREGKYPSVRERDTRLLLALATTTVGLLSSPGPQEPFLAAFTLVSGMSALQSPVWLGLANETDFPHQGHLDFVNNQVDPSTATLQLRGVFPNPKPAVGPRLLSPGQFVRVQVAVSAPYDALLVIQSALGTDLDQEFVYVLDENNAVVRRAVQTGTEHEGHQVIREGLQPSDRVLVTGLQQVHPGMVVSPRLVPMPTPAAETTNSMPPMKLKSPPPSSSAKP